MLALLMTNIGLVSNEYNTVASHTVKATYYNPVRSQCINVDITADGSKIDMKKLRSGDIRWIAISRDLRVCYNFGDTVVVTSNNPKLSGEWVVKDVMGKRHKMRIDFLSHEKDFMLMPELVTIRKKV